MADCGSCRNANETFHELSKSVTYIGRYIRECPYTIGSLISNKDHSYQTRITYIKQ